MRDRLIISQSVHSILEVQGNSRDRRLKLLYFIKQMSQSCSSYACFDNFTVLSTIPLSFLNIGFVLPITGKFNIQPSPLVEVG